MAGRQVVNVCYTNNSQQQCSRCDLIQWVNDKLKAEFNKIEELCTGAAYCNLMDYLFRGCINMKRVKFISNQEYEYIENFRLLQQSFNALEIETHLPIEQLVKARFQDNFEFSLWFKMFFEINQVPEMEPYDAMIARGNMPIGLGSANASMRSKTPGPKKANLLAPLLWRSRSFMHPLARSNALQLDFAFPAMKTTESTLTIDNTTINNPRVISSVTCIEKSPPVLENNDKQNKSTTLSPRVLQQQRKKAFEIVNAKMTPKAMSWPKSSNTACKKAVAPSTPLFYEDAPKVNDPKEPNSVPQCQRNRSYFFTSDPTVDLSKPEKINVEAAFAVSPAYGTSQRRPMRLATRRVSAFTRAGATRELPGASTVPMKHCMQRMSYAMPKTRISQSKLVPEQQRSRAVKGEAPRCQLQTQRFISKRVEPTRNLSKNKQKVCCSTGQQQEQQPFEAVKTLMKRHERPMPNKILPQSKPINIDFRSIASKYYEIIEFPDSDTLSSESEIDEDLIAEELVKRANFKMVIYDDDQNDEVKTIGTNTDADICKTTNEPTEIFTLRVERDICLKKLMLVERATKSKAVLDVATIEKILYGRDDEFVD